MKNLSGEERRKNDPNEAHDENGTETYLKEERRSSRL